MLNRAPIFVHGLRRSGTDLLADIMSSHPDVCQLSGETHHVFHGRPDRGILDIILGREKALQYEYESREPDSPFAELLARRAAYWPLEALANGRLMRPRSLKDRRPLPPLALRYIDLFFYIDKVTSPFCGIKHDGASYTKAEKRASRFLTKSIDGTILVNENFAAAYPDATFIGIIRDGLAVCEDHVRRGTKAEKFAQMYDRVCRKMLEYSRTIRNYHIVRYEDMVSDPVGFMRTVYGYAGLDPDSAPKVFLRAKRVMQSDGSLGYTFGSRDREINWFAIDEMPRIILNNANENQRRRLSDKDRKEFNSIAGGVMKELGYEL